MNTYEQARSKINEALPDYPELEKLWFKLLSDKIQTVNEKRYLGIGLTKIQLAEMATADVSEYRATLTDNQFRLQLDDLFAQTKERAIAELNREEANSPEAKEPEGDVSSILVQMFFEWVGSSILNNIAGAGRESGEGAKLLRITLGISIEDIKKYGIFGGRNSFFRKPLG